ncbi:toll-like receptor 2 [Zophobas morio]|uniref:toll-like receptor 2 n=1 Tax=Zophobas morio TaxID=2755281 RepID=UPI00308309E0
MLRLGSVFALLFFAVPQGGTVPPQCFAEGLSPTCQGPFTGLTKLCLKGCNLTTFPPDVEKIPMDLTILEISRNNEFTFISKGMLSNFVQLTELCLFSNFIENIENYSFAKLTALRRLDLSFNQLTFVSKEMLFGLSSLTYLTLWSNKIGFMKDDSFSHLSALYHLELFENSVKRIPSFSFWGLKNLRLLNLRSNPITEIEIKAFDVSLRPDNIKVNLDKKFLCCSRNHYKQLNYVDQNCTYNGDIVDFETFDKKCPSSRPKSLDTRIKFVAYPNFPQLLV